MRTRTTTPMMRPCARPTLLRERTKSYGSFFEPQRPSAPLADSDATLLAAALAQSPPNSSRPYPRPRALHSSLLRKASSAAFDAVAPPRTRRRCCAEAVGTLAREALVGGIAFFFVTVFAAAFASTTSADVSFLRPRGPDLVRIATLGFVAGAPFVFLQKLPYAMPLGPDLGVAPLLGLVAEGIGKAYPDGKKLNTDDDDAFAAVILAWALATLLIGISLTSLSRLRLLRFVDYIPFPVICGLLASIGVELVVAAVGLAARSGGWRAAPLPVAVAALLTSVDTFLRVRCVSPEVRFSIVIIVPTALFHLVTWGFGMGLSKAWLLGHGGTPYVTPSHDLVHDARLGPPPLWALHQLWRDLVTGSPRGQRALDAFCGATRPLLAVVALAILKAPMAQAAMRRSLAPPEEIEPRLRRRFRRRPAVAAQDDNFELATLGFCSVLSAVLSGAVLGQQISLSAIARGLGKWQRAPGAIAVALALVALWQPHSQFSRAREFVPRFVYSALVAGQGIANVDRWLIGPSRVLPPQELCVTVLIVCVVRFAGLATGLTAGAVASVGIFAFASLAAPVVKYAATALTVRSSVERDHDEAARLDTFGDHIGIFAVQGFLFFGNGRRVVEFVRAWLDDSNDAHYAILDLAHATDANASAVDALLEAARLVQATHRREVPALYICGAHEDVQRALRRRQLSGGAAMKQALDVDSALGDCEARLLRDLREGNAQTPTKCVGGAVVSFDRALTTAVRRSALSGPAADAELEALLKGPGLRECAAARRLRNSEALLPHGAAGDPTGHDDALYIVAAGRMNVRRDPNQSTGARLRKARRHAPSFRIAELGPGSIIGTHEFVRRTRSVGVFMAAEPCLLYKLPFAALDALATSDPSAHGALWRLIAGHLCGEAERTKWRLSSIVDLLHSVPLREPIARRTLRAMGSVEARA